MKRRHHADKPISLVFEQMEKKASVLQRIFSSVTCQEEDRLLFSLFNDLNS
jgi:hypothetical protein